MRFAFIRDHRGVFPVDLMCRALGVSRSGSYAWRGRPPSPRVVRREQLVGQIRQVHEEARSVYGSPRVHRELEARGVACCEDTVAELMRASGIRSKARRRFVARTTDSRHGRPVGAVSRRRRRLWCLAARLGLSPRLLRLVAGGRQLLLVRLRRLGVSVARIAQLGRQPVPRLLRVL